MLPLLKVLEEAISPQHHVVFTSLIEANEKLGIHAILRVAGGWVRDTLLGLHSNDIDIAIETPCGLPPVSGEQFARNLARYQADQTLSTERTVSVIRVNPALSKHIETATVCVNNVPVEFCALRTDTYTESSRIPCTSPGTPLEDARRRDFTVNALFFNLHSHMVEDYTNGLADLESRTIRTPLEPKETFEDDPLRLLRGIRFVGQLGKLNFHLDDAIFRAVDDSLLRMLEEKVSRERIGKEFSKMLSSPKPEKCLDLLLRMNILQKVLLVEVQIPPSRRKHALTDAAAVPTAYSHRRLADDANGAMPNRLEYLELVIHNVVPLFAEEEEIFIFSKEDQLVAILFTLTVSFYRGMTSDQLEESLVGLCLNGLKLSKTEFQCLRRMIEAFNKLDASRLSQKEFASVSSGVLSLETKGKVFDALIPLHDPKVLRDAFKVVLCMYAVLGWSNHPSHDASHQGFFSSLPLGQLSNVRRTAQCVWDPLSHSFSSLLDAFSYPLPLDGNHLLRHTDIPPKEIGAALMELRREIALKPGTVNSVECALTWVRDWYTRKSSQTGEEK